MKVERGQKYKYISESNGIFENGKLYEVSTVFESTGEVVLNVGISSSGLIPKDEFARNFSLAQDVAELPSPADDFKEICKSMIATYVKKNHDYGSSFDKSLDKFGIVAAVVRIGDKMNRIESLAGKKAQVTDESIRDTLVDMANYCVMTVMWLDNQKKTCNL